MQCIIRKVDDNNNLFIFRELNIKYNYVSNIWSSVKLNSTIKHINIIYNIYSCML